VAPYDTYAESLSSCIPALSVPSQIKHDPIFPVADFSVAATVVKEQRNLSDLLGRFRFFRILF